MTMKRPLRILTAILGVGMLLASALPATAAPAPAVRASSPSLAWSAESEECKFLTIINDYRSKNGLGKLTISLTLADAAEFHSKDMAVNGYFSHTLSDGSTWAQNIKNFGYPQDTARAENIAAGRGAAADVFQQWKNSPGHNANMLSPKFNAIGIGRYTLTGSQYTHYWTNTFGSVVDKSYACNTDSTGGGEPGGTTLLFAGGGRTRSSTSSMLAYDGTTDTTWNTTSTAIPRAAYVYFDLGVVKPISKVAWVFSKNGGADSYKVQVSTDKVNWTTITNRKGAYVGQWRSKSWTGKARYVRFYFENPNKDLVLGYLGEVRVYA